MESIKYEIKNTFHRLEGHGRKVPLVLYQPLKKTERSKIAVLAMHGADFYLCFPPMIKLAELGYTAAGAVPTRINVRNRMMDVQVAVEFLKNLPGIEKVVLMGHSNGGCLMSCYQYIAENGTARFQRPERILPFPEIDPLPPADGLMLLDTNYGIMDVLSMDPAVRTMNNGYDRIPELDIYNPENGYKPGGAEYTPEFIRRFQHAQAQQYKDLFAYAVDRWNKIQSGRGRFADDEPILIPGAGGGSSANKLFVQDNRLLGRTRKERPLLHRDGSVTTEIVRTVRVPNDAPSSTLYERGSRSTTVRRLLEEQYLFGDDFGYDECTMWGADWDFSPSSSRANVKGISVPLLCEGNTASVEFIQTEYNYGKEHADELSRIKKADRLLHKLNVTLPIDGKVLRAESVQLRADVEAMLPELESVKAELDQQMKIRSHVRKVLPEALTFRSKDGQKRYEDVSEEIQNQNELRALLDQSAERVIRHGDELEQQTAAHTLQQTQEQNNKEQKKKQEKGGR